MRSILRSIKRALQRGLFQIRCLATAKKAVGKIEDLPLDTLFRLDIPTYDGSGQAVHPSLLVNSGTPRFVLAFTPYADTDDRVENPSVVISDDGLSFQEEKPGLNPLVPAPEKDHNDDPDLFYCDGRYCLLYLETMRPEKQSLVLLESADRLHWEKKILHQENLAEGKGCFMLSPKYIEKDGVSYLFYVNRDAPDGYRIEYVAGRGIGSLDFACRNIVTVTGLKALPWHLDIIPYHTEKGQSWCVLLTTASGLEKDALYTLRLAESHDLMHWSLRPGLEIQDCYRSSGFIMDGVLYLYISKIFFPRWKRKKWKILLYKTKK